MPSGCIIDNNRNVAKVLLLHEEEVSSYNLEVLQSRVLGKVVPMYYCLMVKLINTGAIKRKNPGHIEKIESVNTHYSPKSTVFFNWYSFREIVHKIIW